MGVSPGPPGVKLRGRRRFFKRANPPASGIRLLIVQGFPMVAASARYRFAVNPLLDNVLHANTVLHMRPGDYHIRGFRTFLTLKSVVEGQANYRTRHTRYQVDDGSMVIFNHGQEYDSDFEARDRTEALTFFFQPGFIADAARSREETDAALLDDPVRRAQPPLFFERLYPKTGPFAALLDEIRIGISSPGRTASWVEEQFYRLADALLGLHEITRREVERFPACRASTREELYRRLHYARDYIHTCYAEPLTVQEIANVACLSPFHFQRMFKLAFSQTPMNCLQARRLDVARKLLLRTEQDVTSICLNVGFESLGSFSWLFRRKFGLSPRQFRAAARPAVVAAPADCRP
ncbi:MAG: hypothetical protein DCC65_09895 [Planctomycetota bacterium]|nr:MAG: hypothetical protein DCC65_09895 [Planctomycetota bacterium]